MAIARQKATARKDIAGLMVRCKNYSRRKKCKLSLRKFCETYLPETFHNEWSPDHLQVISRIEDAVLRGELFALAMPRGNGKTSLCKAAVLWAALYAHRRYIYLIAANATKAIDILEAIKTFIRFQVRIVEDFPEVAIPFQALEGIAHRSGGQIINGVPTRIKFEKDNLVFPYVENSKKQPVPTTNIVINCSGLTGAGIRGSAKTTANGETIRPDLVIIDDPQTDESAASVSQNQTREKLISGAVLGMAGPGQKIAGIMPCTVIEPDDMIDRVLNVSKHPVWRGKRYQMLTKMPKNMEAWEKYYEVYKECFSGEKIDYERINNYYTENQKILEEGAAASWEERKSHDEVSAIQHAMHLFFRDENAFFAEYQNTPKGQQAGDTIVLPWKEVCKRSNNYAHKVIPTRCEKLVDMIDVQGKCLWFARVAFSPDGTGYCIDYGAWPEQGSTYYQLSKIRNTMQRQFPQTPDLESQIYLALKSLCDDLLKPSYREDGIPVIPSTILIDSAWGTSTKTVYRFCHEYGKSHPQILSFRGRGIGASACPMAEFKKKPGETLSSHWHLTRAKDYPVRRFDSDINHWKTELHRRLAKQPGEIGGMSFFKGSESRHRMISEQLTAEVPVRVSAGGRQVDEWKHPNKTRDNHLLDCMAGIIAGADAIGIRPRAATVETKAESKSIKRNTQRKSQRKQAKYH